MEKVLKSYLGKKIVIDTSCSMLFIGVLQDVLPDSVELTDVDVHDNRDILTSKELYVLESMKTGVKSNREKVHINMDFVVSFSALTDVKVF